jgi:predicted molibdopterin-dependent oxidoreductase YjgC
LAEKEGTFTNVQGRVQKFERSHLPKSPIRAHWELLLLLAVALGWGDRAWTPSDLLRQIANEIAAYRDVKEAELAGGFLLKKGDFPWKGRL